MKKALIALAVVCSLLAVIISGLLIGEQKAKSDLEGQVGEFLDECGVTATSIDVHGRPYLLYAAKGDADLTYADLDPVDGTNKDQLLIHRLSHGTADRLTRFITFDYPSAGATPVLNDDGSYSEFATIKGKKVTFSAQADDTKLQVFADGRPAGELKLPQSAEVKGVSAQEVGIGVEIEYSSSSCR
ncbi:hypothetical protein [Brevibacterium oceani]|uniref:hypothetical protein n=1 Tax=Brevibacterium oceani TaxID=358099 RepID=UPI0015E7AB32|nr:hypothetical protein [Brevibacterium oceani]